MTREDAVEILETARKTYPGKSVIRDAFTLALAALQPSNEPLTLESIAQGILVLGKDVTYCVEQLGWMPPVVLGEEPPVPEEPEPSSPQCTGRNAAEKRRIFERLQLFRGANGLGCLRRISDKCTFGITDDLLRDILTGNASPTIKEWREIGRALDELEGKGAASE